MMGAAVLTPAERAFLLAARRAILATIRADGSPRLVPICFALVEPGSGGDSPAEASADAATDASTDAHAARPTLYSPLDEKPKRVTDVRHLARVRDILARPSVGLLVDRWDEDWGALGWLRLDGEARLVEPEAGAEHARAVTALRDRYPQYREQDIGSRPLLRIDVVAATSWGTLG